MHLQHTALTDFLAAMLIVFGIGCNPFAPAAVEGDPFGDLLGDPKTVEGFFTNFRNAYELQDIVLYETLLDSSFVFTYHDFDSQIDREWRFSQELESTRRLFQSTTFGRLQWNQILSQDQFANGLQTRVVRSFNISISLETGEDFQTDGNVNFVLVRADSLADWSLLSWRDESEF
jgi:hypothetical protein